MAVSTPPASGRALPGSAVTAAAGQLLAEGRPGRSSDANSVALTMLNAPFTARRAILAQLSAAEIKHVVNEVARETGSFFGLYYDSPSGFTEDVVGDALWSMQREILDSVVTHTRTAVPAGFGVGKTYLAGRLVAWAGSVNPAGSMKIVTTATRFRQVRYQLWPHIRKAIDKGKLPGETDTTQWRAPNIYGTEEVVAYGFTAPSNDEAAMQGIHGTPKLLLVVDEAGGIAKLIGRGTNNLLTGDARMLAIGNPAMNDPGSWFEELCAEGLNPEVPSTTTIRVSTLHSPAITGEPTPVCRDCTHNIDGHTISLHLPNMDWLVRTLNDYGVPAHRDWTVEQILEACKDAHPYVVAKVLAMFPTGASNRIIPAGWVEAAAEAPDPLDHSGCEHAPDKIDDKHPCVANAPAPGYRKVCELGLEGETATFTVKTGSWVRLGVDVAADGGDEVTIYRSIGDVVHQLHASSGAVNADQVAVAERVLVEILRAERLAKALGTPQRVRVKVDKNGIGQGVTSMLIRWGPDGTRRHNAEIVGVMVSEKPEIDDPGLAMRPWRKRDEMWLAGRQLLQPDPSTGLGRLRLRVDHQCRVQLSNPKEKFRAGYTVVESKVEMKSRGIDSPDRAEGALLALYEPFPIRQRKRRGLLN